MPAAPVPARKEGTTPYILWSVVTLRSGATLYANAFYDDPAIAARGGRA